LQQTLGCCSCSFSPLLLLLLLLFLPPKTQDAMSWLAVHFIYTAEQMQQMKQAATAVDKAAAAAAAAAAQEAGAGSSTGAHPGVAEAPADPSAGKHRSILAGSWHWRRVKKLNSKPKC
jgi:type IV secretory pathway TrbL component